jgi:hypothetical protein
VRLVLLVHFGAQMIATIRMQWRSAAEEAMDWAHPPPFSPDWGAQKIVRMSQCLASGMLLSSINQDQMIL